MKNLKLLFILFLFSAPIHAEAPPEIQGVWVPDVENSIALMKENMRELDEAGLAFMRERVLPSKKITITKSQYIHRSGDRELTADISLKEKIGNKYVMLLTSESAPGLVVTFIPKENGKYIMTTENPSDGSGSILWGKQL